MRMRDFIYSIMNNSINNNITREVYDEWNRFLEDKPVNNDLVPEEIFKSWVRNRSLEIDPFGNNPIILDNSRKNELTPFHQMVREYGKFFEIIDDMLDKDFLLTIYDKNLKSGRLVELLGNRFIELLIERQEQTIGYEFSEQLVGTTASSLAIQENRPMLVLGNHHYQRRLHEFNGVAAPIHNKKNEVIGVLGLVYYDLKQSAKAYFLVKYLAKLFDIFYSMIIDEHENQLNHILDLLPQGIAYMNGKNVVQSYNQKLLDMLKIDTEQDIQQQLKKSISKIGIGTTFNKKEFRVDINEKPTDIYIIPQQVDDKLYNQSNKLVIFEEYSRAKEVVDCNHELYSFDDIIGHNQVLQEAKAMAMKVAKTSVPVLIWGENGTGKEMFAQAIHHASNRRNHPFIAINCGAIPADIVESELFGYEEGSFTGALKGGKIGKIEAASGGSLFLDEIESMPLHVQIKLLRVLSTDRILKVGGTKEIPVDLRIIAATKKELLKEADRGLFREDLYYRLSTFIIKIPALRERKDDIQQLAHYFIEKLSNKYALSDIKTDNDTLNALASYLWRGNVRELEHTIERAIILMGTEKVLTVHHLPEKIQVIYQYSNTKELIQIGMNQSEKKKGLLALAEEIVIKHSLITNGGNISEAAKQLGIDRKTIYNKLQKYPNLYEKYVSYTKESDGALG